MGLKPESALGVSVGLPLLERRGGSCQEVGGWTPGVYFFIERGPGKERTSSLFAGVLVGS